MASLTASFSASVAQVRRAPAPASRTLGFPARWCDDASKHLDMKVQLCLSKILRKNAERKYKI